MAENKECEDREKLRAISLTAAVFSSVINTRRSYVARTWGGACYAAAVWLTWTDHSGLAGRGTVATANPAGSQQSRRGMFAVR